LPWFNTFEPRRIKDNRLPTPLKFPTVFLLQKKIKKTVDKQYHALYSIMCKGVLIWTRN
jgi:hypothetical protein